MTRAPAPEVNRLQPARPRIGQLQVDSYSLSAIITASPPQPLDSDHLALTESPRHANPDNDCLPRQDQSPSHTHDNHWHE